MFIELHTAGEPRLYESRHIIEVVPREKGSVVFTPTTGVIGNYVDERYEVIKAMLKRGERDV
jgi:hypothetical protein